MSEKPRRDWQLDQRDTVYQGFYRLEELRFRHTLHRGGWTDSLSRELFVRGDVVAVLPYDPRTDEVVLVEQFRIGAMHQSPSPWQLEVIAGMIDSDESPEQVARREAMEEAGLVLDFLELVSHYLASPGSSTEEVYVYFATADLGEVVSGRVFGLEDEDEDILLHRLAADRAIAMLDSREVRNAISIIALQWLARYRDR